MSHKNLQQFIRKMESAGELLRISAEVDPELEVTEITDRVSKAHGPALLFEHVKGSSFPLLINAFGSYKRMQMALMCESFDEIAGRIESHLKIRPPRSLKEKIGMLFTLKDMADIIPKKVRHAACQQREYGPE